ncbi:uncharacterized protein SAPINGB_P001692 [Magnusiomyces paraingens]|uniref:Mitochondrial acidic protein MAM33 n=1 Tax=Magnusiomyces paraingens TaxID=2606893 RepID=A0A5E8B6Z3_9ASCO|nr:uncharacterized protein SAPINGB_P001692 [Saprochaete ingens]VVT47400.1 unnamed protein product [Saprochaete ingens]
MIARIALRSARQVAIRRLPVAAMASASRIPAFSAIRTFSATTKSMEKLPLTASDAQLSRVLKNEINIEVETSQENPEADSAKWLEKSGFQLIAKDGTDEIELIKKEGGEVIHIFFSVSDITNGDAYDFNNDEFAENEHSEEAAEEEEDADFIEAPPIRANIVVEKASGALSIESVIQSNLLLVENVTPYESADVALANTSEADFKRRSIYQGPAFSNLDENLQSALEQYLESRGIDAGLASFISDYANVRENNEYILWLKKIQNFVEA